MKSLLWISLSFALLPPLAPSDLESIGKRVWHNEAAGKIEGLTAWNQGESFASLGIGHFIWYPQGENGPFEESFPTLVDFLQKQGVSLPFWLTPKTPCPWRSRSEFLADFQSSRLQELRKLLASTLPQQSQFLALRLDAALPLMLREAAQSRRPLVEQNYRHLAATAAGRFALIDYVNFKGEGTKASERYQGQGWGLLQVLEEMPVQGSPGDFGRTAAKILQRRVRNAPPERREERWLAGWTQRVLAYAQ